MNANPHLAIIGAGIAGLACARSLADSGVRVTVLDKSRGPGGRTSTRRGEGWACDHGAQYFTARHPDFIEELAAWQAAGVAAPWPARLTVFDSDGRRGVHGEEARFVGTPRMTAPARHLARGLDLRVQLTVSALQRYPHGWEIATAERGMLPEAFDGVLLAVPSPQAVPLLLPLSPALAATAQAARMQACWALMARFDAPLAVDFDAAFVNRGPLRWVARDRSKPGRDGLETWSLHASAEWSEAHIEDAPERVAVALVGAFEELGGRMPLGWAAHRWRYAITESALDGGCAWDAAQALGLCGDWANGGRVEGAWLSGRALARRVLDGLAAGGAGAHECAAGVAHDRARDASRSRTHAQERAVSYGLVWFKRDLRLADHAALATAARRGPVLCVLIVEPSLWAQPDAARQHYEFMLESARELHAGLARVGGRLHLLVGEAVEVLDRLHAAAPFDTLHSHEETGNAASYARDRAVARWCRARGVRWHEPAQFGVVRRLDDRDRWQAAWEAQVAAPQVELPEPSRLRFVALPAALQPGAGATWPDRGAIAAVRAPTAVALGLDAFEPPRRQRGGRHAALEVLHDFLDARSGQYRGGISSPLKAPTACSRLSPYLAWGCLSLRELVQATRARVAALPEGDRRRAGLAAFLSRLYWHCHFIQKLESEPTLEFRNLHRGYDGLREPEWNQAHFDALVGGRTGWPLVDACVAMLRATGWLNFRMRAMLVSVAAYPLWLHWREVGLWLPRAFLDYEPGIHWSQLQMQSGTTGINTTRVYNPIKQARDHDPQGVFVRRWLPALRRVPDIWLFEPWRMPESVQARCGVRVGEDIALPVVDLETATRAAKTRIHALRAQPEVRAAKAAIVERHGSRKPPQGRRKTVAGSASGQLDLGF